MFPFTENRHRAQATRWCAPLALLAWVAAGGCALMGGSGKLDHAEGYAVSAPKDWKSVSGDDSDRAYRLPSGNVVSFTSSCHRDSAAPLEVLTRQLLMGTRHVRYLRKERLPVSGQEGLYSSVEATLDGSPFHLELFVLSKNSCIFDFSLVSPKPVSLEEQKEFLTFIKSFNYGKN